MYVILYALKNLIRYKGRNLLLGIILFAMLTLTGISLILYKGTKQIAMEYQAQHGSKVILLSSLQAEPIPQKTLLSFGDSAYVHSSGYDAKVAIHTTTIQTIGETAKEGASAWLMSFHNPAIKDAFRNETKRIIKGTSDLVENQVLISKQLAEKNNLDVGSTLSFMGKKGETALTYTIAGIYDDLSLQGAQETIALRNPANELYMDEKALLTSNLFQTHGELQAIFYLKHPEDLSQFQAELKEKGLPDGYEASIDRKGYEEMIKPIESLHHIALMATIGILIFGGMLLLFLTTFFVRERKYEIGVLRSMGMKKHFVALTLMFETMGICMIALSLAMISAQWMGQQIGAQMLEKQIALAQQIEMQTSFTNIVFGVDLMMVATLIVITLLLGSCASLSGLISIMRFQPNTILANRT